VLLVIARAVQWVRHRPDALPGGLARELRIGVERDDVLDRGEHGSVADDGDKTVFFREVVGRAEQGI